MKLRIARKVWNAVGTDDEHRYRERTIEKAERRTRQTCEYRESVLVEILLKKLSVDDRARILAKLGDTRAALRLLMRHE